jgi:[ribosomal protein S5]-alanine N-acetyltransferase
LTRTIQSARLELVPLTEEMLTALLEGERADCGRLGGFVLPDDWPDDHDRRFLRFRLRQMRNDLEPGRWLVCAVVRRDEERPMVGHIGFHGPRGVNSLQAPDAVEIGYTIFPDHRRQGYATEAVVALLGWARTQGIHRFVASVGPQNEPSLAIVRRLGFREVGRHWDDEDGEELEFELAAEPA